MKLDMTFLAIGMLIGSAVGAVVMAVSYEDLRIVPATHVSGGRFRPGQRLLMLMRVTPNGPEKLASIPVPRRLWERWNR